MCHGEQNFRAHTISTHTVLLPSPTKSGPWAVARRRGDGICDRQGFLLRKDSIVIESRNATYPA